MLSNPDGNSSYEVPYIVRKQGEQILELRTSRTLEKRNGDSSSKSNIHRIFNAD